MTSLRFAAPRIKHGNTSSTNVTFPVPNKWSRQTRTQKKTSKNITKQSQVTSFVQFKTLHTPISSTKAFLRLLASVKILQRVHSRPARSVCSFNGCTLSDRQLLPYHWATSILPKGKNKQVEIEIVWNCMKLFCPCWYHRYLFLGSKYTTYTIHCPFIGDASVYSAASDAARTRDW